MLLYFSFLTQRVSYRCSDPCWRPGHGDCDPYRICINGACSNSPGRHEDACSSGSHVSSPLPHPPQPHIHASLTWLAQCLGAGAGKCIDGKCRHGAPCEVCRVDGLTPRHSDCGDGLCNYEPGWFFGFFGSGRCDSLPPYFSTTSSTAPLTAMSATVRHAEVHTDTSLRLAHTLGSTLLP